jgi:hypothetical protein
VCCSMCCGMYKVCVKYLCVDMWLCKELWWIKLNEINHLYQVSGSS